MKMGCISASHKHTNQLNNPIMKRNPTEDISSRDCVNIQEPDKRRLQDDPELMMALIDLLFMNQDYGTTIPS